MDETFIPERITQLRLMRNISEYQMSLELGCSKGYVQSITSGKNLPSVKQLFNIADYFDMTVAEFFAPENKDPPELCAAIQALRRLSSDDIALLKGVICRVAALSEAGKGYIQTGAVDNRKNQAEAICDNKRQLAKV